MSWGAKPWRRPPLQLLAKTYDILAETVTLKALNKRLFLTRWWSTFLTDLGFSLDGQGIPVLHSGGGGIVVDRAQVAYVERSGKPTDYRIMAPDEHRPKYDRRGLLVESGGAVNSVLNSTFSQGAVNAFTNWTNVESGTGQVLGTTTQYQFDVEGLRRAAHLLVGATDASEAQVTADFVNLPSGQCRIRVRTENLFGAAKLAMVAQRQSDSKYYRDSDQTWQATISDAYNRVGSNASGFRDWHSKEIATDPGDNLVITVGYFAEAGTQNFQALVTSVELYRDAKFIGSDLPTTDSPVTREADSVTIQNNESALAWDSRMGSFNLTVEPLWDPADLTDDEEKSFWTVVTFVVEDGIETVIIEEVLFRKESGSNKVIYRRGGIEAFRSFTPTKGVPFKISARWVSSAGELDLPAFTHQVAVDNVWGSGAVLGDVPSLEPTGAIFVGSNGEDSWADAFLSHADVSPLVLTDEELARRP